jgi:peptidoglycan hydrolase-like protein with peptidoglycan-binding domain
MLHLKAGATGDPVRELQAYLKILCHFSGNPNGQFDDATASAVKALQHDLKLVESGELDRATDLELDTRLSLLRGALHCLGLFATDAGLSDNDVLRQALIDFQTDQSIAPSGCYDPPTRSALKLEITKLQSKLYFLGHYKAFVDGTYNTAIVPAILAFQKRLGLALSGIRDGDTRLALIHAATIKPDGDETPERSKREIVGAMQRKLYCCGYYHGPQHGLYDAPTVAAVTLLQKHHRLPRLDGVCDDYTWWQLNQDAGTVFAEAFQWELDALDEEHSGIIPDKADPRPAADSDVVHRAHRDQLCGLSFSGGGIRSATFNLGISQALAEQRLLREFHYLSTVSGGGYIGSWLSKWIHEEAGEVEKVEEQLAISTRNTPSKTEPDQIKFLRQYSNFLTPKTGLFGADTWAVIATYLRNVMLNMAILAAVLSALMLVPRLLLWLVNKYSMAVKYGEVFTPGYARWFGGIALVSFLVAVFFISLNISLIPHPRNKQRWLFCQEQECVLARVVAPLMISGFFGSVWLWYEYEGIQGFLVDWHYWIVATIVYLIVWGAAWILGQRVNLENNLSTKSNNGFWSLIAPHLGFSVAALIIGHLLIASVISQLDEPVHSRDPLNHPVNLITFGMPVALAIFGISMVLLVGLLGRAYSDRSREWWSRMGGWTIIFTSGWVMLFTICLYGPPFITWLSREIGAWASSTLTLAWLLPSIAGVLYGKSERSDVTPTSRMNDRLLAIAPPIFVLGMLLLVTCIIQALITQPIFPDEVKVTLGNYFHKGFYAAELTPIKLLLASIAGCAVVATILAWRVDINKFSMYMMYRNRLVRCYLGASNKNREPHPFTGFDTGDDPHLTELLWKLEPENSVGVHRLQKPFHLLNTALNLVKGKELAWQQRKAASFFFSPGFCGFETPERSGHLKPNGANDLARGCFRATREYGAGKRDIVGGNISVGGMRDKLERFRDEEEGVKLGQAMAVSGAAASPNMGYHSNPALSFLMTAFNVRLGRWNANPRQDAWRTSSPQFGLGWLVRELLGSTNADSRYVYLSDGGHFENLGIYELVRRRCALIVAIDAGADGGTTFNDLGGAMRKCFTDFGIEIDIQVKDLEIDAATKLAKSHWAIGEIKYGLVDANCESGLLLYVKPSLTGNEPADLLNYRNVDNKFPHQSTADQYFDETQFESYRKLGYHIGSSILAEICQELERKMVGNGNRRAALIKLLRRKLKQSQSLEHISEEQMLIHELKGKLSSARQSPAAGKLSGGNWSI